MIKFFIIFLFIEGFFFAQKVEAATVKGNVIIQRSDVKLSDLFDGLDPGEDKILGPAPPPGQTIEVGGGQLIAIADEYGVDWAEQSSVAVVHITRAGKSVDKGVFVKILRQKMNLKDNVAIKISDFNNVIVPATDDDPIEISDIYLDEKTGHFSATVKRTHPIGDINKDSFLLNGIIYNKHVILCFTHAMSSGDIISTSDVKLSDNYDGNYSSHTVTDPEDIEGLSLKKNVSPGEVVQIDDFQKTLSIKKGDSVLIMFKAQGLHLTAMGKALEDGARGKMIHVVNSTSNMIINAKVVSAGEVEVQSGLATAFIH